MTLFTLSCVSDGGLTPAVCAFPEHNNERYELMSMDRIEREFIRNKYAFKWHCFFRCNQTDEETIDLMAEAGCIGAFLGLESASEPVFQISPAANISTSQSF